MGEKVFRGPFSSICLLKRQVPNQDNSDVLFNEKGDNEHEHGRDDNLIVFFRSLVGVL